MIYSNSANQASYPFVLEKLPFNASDFSPYFSTETFDYHHGKHHQTYVTNLNNLLKERTELHNKTLEELICLTKSDNIAIFNNAAQVWNHTFFWHSITPNGGKTPTGKLLEKINETFGSFEKFAQEFTQAGISQFGSGWAWLVVKSNKLQIIKTANAETPITEGALPILACDVWEHSYYIDYRNNRLDYIKIYIEHMINWSFAEENYTRTIV